MNGLEVSPLANPLSFTVFFGALALAPFVALGLTSFLKLSVVFGILRNALGAGQLPSASVSSLLAFALSIHIMAPVTNDCYQALRGELEQKQKKGNGGAQVEAQQSVEQLLSAVSAAARPLAAFLQRHSRVQELTFFAELSRPEGSSGSVVEPGLTGYSLSVLIPAFVLSELQEAFVIGFTIYLPFLVVDLVVANLLMGLGMMMLSPTTVALPLKLLLFVGCDGWLMLSRSLILGYG